jgi:hypothetical protein
VFYADGGMIYTKDVDGATQATLNALRLHALDNMTIVGTDGVLQTISTARRAPQLETWQQRLFAHLGGIIRVELVPASQDEPVALEALKEMVYRILSENAKEDGYAANHNRRTVKSARSFAEVIEAFKDH